MEQQTWALPGTLTQELDLCCHFALQAKGAFTSVCIVTGPVATSGPRPWRSGELSTPPPPPASGRLTFSVSFLRSITLGGFGADRFYLGQWREGLGKLFSFGGLGIWTLIDVLLIGVGYVGPADGSLYI